MKKIKEIWQKYREMILYVVFGGGTTLVNILAYYFLTRAMHMDITLSTILAWVLSVLFAYTTNRTWVFQSRETSKKGIVREIIAFFGARLATGLLDLGVMFVFVDLMQFPDMLIKILSNILVIILNYIFSKLFIFKKN